MKNENYIGMKINKWEILKYEKDAHGGKWLCRCECGEEKWQKVCNIKNGKSKMCRKCSSKLRRKEAKPKQDRIIKIRFDSNKEWSDENTFIGTYKEYLIECRKRREKRKEENRYIPISYDRLYKIYSGMKDRCYNKNSDKYKNYGERGVIICEEWLKDYKLFKEWAEINGYSDELTIDRINVNGNYEPSNCRWATIKEQQNNRRNNHYIEYKGEIKTLKEWSEITGINYDTLRLRLKRGLSFEKSIQKKVPIVRTEKARKKIAERKARIEEKQRTILIRKLKKALNKVRIYKAKETYNSKNKK